MQLSVPKSTKNTCVETGRVEPLRIGLTCPEVEAVVKCSCLLENMNTHPPPRKQTTSLGYFRKDFSRF